MGVIKLSLFCFFTCEYKGFKLHGKLNILKIINYWRTALHYGHQPPKFHQRIVKLTRIKVKKVIKFFR